ncbi:3-oxoadipate enol-lactonase [Kutzneria viridogrisea]|uniref:3-oxoadipate enol-lactonase/4-carboxymuconolactone decarboxylase n=1 Tax=Kutzneria viridogrisea TaxID=47990 RepID=A0ABR6BJJ5_9PSEU|nr:3-oxoadipate enol-lactonase/4-carboxymuconolactone decarboxylase [Kutzneria viridogrisea]
MIRYSWSGLTEGPVLVLGNSLGTTSAMWDRQVPALGEHFRLLRYEHRGHGGSVAPPGPYTVDELGADVLALLDVLGLERVSYCGLSLGGMVGMWLAATAPERVDRLALCCTTAKFDSAQPWLDRAAAVREHGTASIAEQVVARWFTPERVDLAPEFTAMLAGTEDEAYASCCEALAELDFTQLVSGIRAPTLVLVGDQDPATPPTHGRALAEAIPGARLARLPAAHLATVQAAEQATALLVDHFTSVRRQVLGDAHVDRALAATDEFTADFQEFIGRYAWGDIWTRPGLDRRTRSCITLAMLATLCHEEELAMHVRAALRVGLSREEIKEVLLQVAVYAGVPAANRAFRVAQQVLSTQDE